MACKNLQECLDKEMDWLFSGGYWRGPDVPTGEGKPCPDCPLLNREKVIYKNTEGVPDENNKT